MATKQRRPAAKKKAAPAKPPTPPARGRATKGPSPALSTRGRNVPAKPKPAPAAPAGPVRGTPTPPGKPGVIAKVAQPKPGATYHRAVLAEFLAAALLALLGGILSPRKRSDGQPTWVHLIVQLTAICGVYFILALLSATEKLGKIAAAFGLLVLLGILLNSADAIRKTAAIFAPAKKPATPAPAAGSAQPGGTGGG